MRWKRLMLTHFILSTAMLMSACGTTSHLRVSQIPLRDDLTRCVALAPVPSEALPPVSEDAAVRPIQLEERAFWLRRDLAQTANNREVCNKQMELLALIRANNEGPE